MLFSRVLLSLLFLFSISLQSAQCNTSPFSSPLWSSLSRSFVSRSSTFNFSHFPLSWSFSENSGSYKSAGHLNFCCTQTSNLLRLLSCPDTNGFATAFIASFLMESVEFIGPESFNSTDSFPFSLQDSTMLLTTEMLGKFHDPYKPGTAAQDFWPPTFGPRVIFNFTGNSSKVVEAWGQTAANIEGVLQYVNSDPGHILEILESLFPALKPAIERLRKLVFLGFATGMTSDFDDSALNLIVGAQLAGLNQKNSLLFPKSAAAWMQNGNNSIQAIVSLCKYARAYSYNPFSSNVNRSQTDPRSYYMTRGFFDQQYIANGNSTTGLPDFPLISVWVASAKQFANSPWGVYRPPEVGQEVDPCVGTNFLLGLFHTIFARRDSWTALLDPTLDLGTMIDTNIQFLVWALQSGGSYTRPDVFSLFYPSKFSFNFFIGRLANLLRRALDDSALVADLKQQHPDFLAVMMKSEASLTPAVQQHSAGFLMSNFTACDQYAAEDKPQFNPATFRVQDVQVASCVYWEDFLGLADLPKPNGADRIYATSLALNGLMAAWTDGTGSALRWMDNTPTSVQSAVAAGIAFLEREIANPGASYQGAFFAGSMHGGYALFPWNDIVGANQNAIINGYVTPSEYAAMLAMPPPGPMKNATWLTYFPGFNFLDQPWPFWSSNAFTQSLALLATTKYDRLQQNIAMRK